MIYVTSDLHIGHDKPFLYEFRGFYSIYDHDAHLIYNWNKIITDEDEVYILGDIMLGDNIYGCTVFNNLNGIKHIILGNHDTANRSELYKDLRGVVDIQYATVLRYDGLNFFLTHYPCITSGHNYDKPLRKRTLNLCGHTHTRDKFSDWDKGYIYHCELDAHDLAPVSIDKIIEDIKCIVS